MTHLIGRTDGRTPNRNAGPQKLHSPSIRCASLRVAAPSLTAWQIQAAPTGKPPAQPSRKIPSPPFGSPRSRARKGSCIPLRFGTSIPVITSSGNRLGISTFPQSARASPAALAAQRLSRISAAMASSSAVVRFFKFITSWKCMPGSLTHRLVRGERIEKLEGTAVRSPE